MLFAISDYIKYKLQIGMYCMKAIEENYATAHTMNATECTNTCKTGDILLVHTTNSFLSWLVMYYTGPTIWSHVATFGSGGYIYDVTINGVIKHHVSDYIDGRSYVAVRRLSGISEEKRAEMEKYLDEIIHRKCKFNWKGVVKMGLLIVLGARKSFRFRYLCDFLILIIAILLLVQGLPALFWIICSLGLLYSVVVFTNCSLRILKGEKFPRF